LRDTNFLANCKTANASLMANTLLSEQQRRQLLEAYIQARPKAARETTREGKRVAGTAVPLTAAQKQLWLHAQLAPDTPLYNEPLTVRYTGKLDVGAMERSFSEILRRHEAWRTVFPVVDGEPVQVVQDAAAVHLPVIDLRNLPDGQREAAALRIAGDDAHIPFDLNRGPLFRAQLVQVADEDFRLFVTLHHLIFDGYSGYRVFLPELAALYESFAQGKPSPLPALDFQFADYALGQQEWQRGAEVEERLQYWKRQLANASPGLALPTATARSGAQNFAGAMRTLQVPAGLSEDLRRLSRQAGATSFMTLLAAFYVLLHRYSGQDDILIGSNTAGRNRPGTEKLLGYFLNTIVLRTDLSGDPSFTELVERVRKVTLGALANDGVPLDRLVAEVQPKRDGNRNPFFQVLFSLEPPLSNGNPGWDLTCIDVETGTSKFELCLVLDDRPDGLLCRFIYNTALFDEGAISRMAGHWHRLLESVVANPAGKISELPILSQPERDQLLVEWNRTDAPKPHLRVDELFEAQVQAKPNAIAVKCGTQRLTYLELNRQADRVARRLQDLGVGPDQAVAICVDRSLEMMVGLMGILKAGGGYVALDPAYPRERLEFMLADCGATVLLTHSRVTALQLAQRMTTVLLDSNLQDSVRQHSVTEPETATFDSLAYMIYTSGSTGAPKGVPVTHGNLAHSNQARLDYYKDPVGNFLLLSSYAFDSSVAGIFHTLTCGGTLVIPPPEARFEPTGIARLIAENSVSHMLTFPSLYAEVLDRAQPAQIASLKTVIVAGEVCPRPLLDRHYQVLPQATLFNEYGPTEATVWSTVYECEPGESDLHVPIGRPIENTQCYVLDRNQQPVPIYVPGELYIGGDGVTGGYRNRAKLSKASFVKSAFAAPDAAKLYRTGDLVRYRPDGNLEFLGRRDQQVKIRGLRIEPAEIEALLAQHPDVREGAVIVHSHGTGEPHLVAYVATREEHQTSSGELQGFLKSRLPASMIPPVFHLLSTLPRTPNGKVDRARLQSDQLQSDQATAVIEPSRIVGPRNEIEKRLLGIWQRVFKMDSHKPENQDVTQDFFALGGHSLLAAELLAGIEKEFGKIFSLAFVFQAPTIELMAESMRTAGQSLRDRAIIPIQPNGSKPALFWIRGGPRFRLLAQKLGPDQPFLGLDLPYWDGSKLPVPYRFEDIAGLLIQAMQEVQPHGPYSLAGLCVNAVLAYEIARQLRAKGEEVGLLALFDGHNQAYYKNPLTDGRYSGRLKYHFSNLLNMNAADKPAYLRDRFDEARRKIERIAWQLTSDRSDQAIGNTDNMIHPAFHRYDPQPYPGKLLLLQSSEWPTGPYFDFRLGWEDVAEGGLEFHWVPGNHPGMFTEPNVNLVASLLSSHL
jgi:surfactin family lipopeptide synthetase A